MSYEPTQPFPPPSQPGQDPQPAQSTETRVDPGPAQSTETRVDPGPPKSTETRVDPGPPKSTETRVDPKPPQSAETRLDPESRDTPEARQERESPQSTETRLDRQWEDSPPTRLDPQWQESPETRQEPQWQQSPQFHPNPPGQQTPQGQQTPRWQPNPPGQQDDQRWQPNPQGQQNYGWQPPPQGQQDDQRWQQPPQGQPDPRWQQNQGGHQDPLPPPRRRRHRVRRSVIALFIILVLAILLVIANFVGKAVAENDMADQFTANGFPVRPSVNIEGFPFLTQVVAKDFKKVVITASNIPAGPVTISSLNATITGMHLNSSWNGATIDHLTATAFVSLSSLTDGISSELGGTATLTAVPDGPDKLKITGSVLGVSASGVVEIKQTGPQQITVELPTTGGLVGTLLGSSASFPINLPAGVPPSLRITGLTLNGNGLTVSAAATNATFSK